MWHSPLVLWVFHNPGSGHAEGAAAQGPLFRSWDGSRRTRNRRTLLATTGRECRAWPLMLVCLQAQRGSGGRPDDWPVIVELERLTTRGGGGLHSCQAGTEDMMLQTVRFAAKNSKMVGDPVSHPLVVLGTCARAMRKCSGGGESSFDLICRIISVSLGACLSACSSQVYQSCRQARSEVLPLSRQAPPKRQPDARRLRLLFACERQRSAQ